MKRMLELLTDFIFPPRCVICGKLLPFGQSKMLCANCADQIPFLQGQRCHMCGREIQQDMLCHRCRTAHFAFSAGAAAFSYATMRHAIADLKYQGCRKDAEGLGTLMTTFLQNNHTDWIDWTDYMTAVPLHPAKKKRRGFNQVEELCREMEKQTGLSFVPDLLVRRVDTTQQSSLSKQERRENLYNVFAVAENKEAVQGKHILLIDDIFTTGTTLQECSRTLLRAGAKEVRVYCLSVVSFAAETEQTTITQETEQDTDISEHLRLFQ